MVLTCISLMAMMLSIFSCAYLQFIYRFCGRNCANIFSSFIDLFVLLLRCKISLYILDPSFCHICVLEIFFPICVCLHIVLTVSFEGLIILFVHAIQTIFFFHLCFMLFVLFQKPHPSQHHKNNLLCFIFKILLFHIHVFNPPSVYFCTVF